MKAERLSCRWCGFGRYIARRRLPSGRLVALCDQCDRRLQQAIQGSDETGFMLDALESQAAERDARSGRS